MEPRLLDMLPHPCPSPSPFPAYLLLLVSTSQSAVLDRTGLDWTGPDWTVQDRTYGAVVAPIARLRWAGSLAHLGLCVDVIDDCLGVLPSGL